MGTVDDRGMTWGEVAAKSRDKWANKWSRAIPPQALYGWNSTQGARLRHMLDVAEGKDPDSLFNSPNFSLNDDNWQVLTAWNEEAGGELTASDRPNLRSAGCEVAGLGVQQPTPAPTAQPITLSSTGSKAETFNLTSGLRIADVSVMGNESCLSSGSCRGRSAGISRSRFVLGKGALLCVSV